ncbi:hypothetical protein CLG96_08235 [Sphingomonas oleivorans]|uniref:Type II secretion system protein GspI n=1 Tax=Sphingomonas oleivorans TaxID=1735121 RepID=A0A2T5FY25_9SPHN|nr:prepilin-type N-terminal cleavage/methylation domain-containing protein [Sphingomonas oleivorans]PTQ11429.1 hypothetical protein CLG96_08235 [Sphingomonas oleivorans]
MRAGAVPDRGFTVIELLVAVVIMAMVLIPVARMQADLSRRHARQAVLLDRFTAMHNALALLRGLNPLAEPSGRRLLAPGLLLQWRATRVSEVRRSLRFLGGEGDFDVALFRIDAQILRSSGGMPMRFAIERLGWRAIPGSAPSVTSCP